MTTLAEPEWDEDTRTLALALDAVEICPRCGGPAYQCQDPELQDDWEALPPVRCHRATAVGMKQRDYTEQTNPIVQALIFRVAQRTKS